MRLAAILVMAAGLVPAARAGDAAILPEGMLIYDNEALGLCYDCARVRIAVAADGGVAITRWRVGPGAVGHHEPVLRRERVSPARVRRFLRALAPYRPGEPQARVPSLCSMIVTEAGGLTLFWNDARGHQQLAVNYNCDPARYKAMFDALHHAPDVLGLGDLLNAKG